MADTAASLITDALGEILVAASEQPIEASEFSLAIRYLNRMMAQFDANGISLGYTVVSNPSDLMTVPDGALAGMMFNLALRLATPFDEPVSPDLRENAKDGLQAMRKLAVTIKPARFPCTLPIGSGNEEQSDGLTTDHFFPCPDDSVLTESGGNISLESET